MSVRRGQINGPVRAKYTCVVCNEEFEDSCPNYDIHTGWGLCPKCWKIVEARQDGK